jgi:hypothetical protein
MENTLDTLSIKLAFNPFDKELRQLCFTMSILKYMLYNKLRKAKRRSYYSDMMFKLNSLSDTNPKAFWDLVNELKYENKSDKGTWENYFKKLNTLSTEKAVLNEKFESLFEIDRSKDLMNELDFSISAKEVTEATKKLKKGKSSGSDSILNEILKYGNFVLQPCLVKLFNIILSSGIYPTEWVQGLIFPIYKTGDPPELKIKKKIPVRHWVLQVREFCQTYFFFRNFLIFHFQYSMIKGTILNKGNNKITELRTILQRESQNS